MRIPNDWRGKDGIELVLRATRKGQPDAICVKTLAELAKATPTADAFRLAAEEAGKRSPDAKRTILAAAVAAWPDDARLHFDLAVLLNAETRPERKDPALALRLARRAVELLHGQHHYFDGALADALLGTGELDEADKLNAALLADGEEGPDAVLRQARIIAAKAAKAPK